RQRRAGDPEGSRRSLTAGADARARDRARDRSDGRPAADHGVELDAGELTHGLGVERQGATRLLDVQHLMILRGGLRSRRTKSAPAGNVAAKTCRARGQTATIAQQILPQPPAAGRNAAATL